ncbi:hypothetical protein HELRODRAFT_87912 [Helobdella robusta]|uniref:Armadillo repeat-containing protein 6 n=1 Tax=Helobdella robusta TaxID=6412 RepID=T1G6W7_HELRO|nr:hypothetical protein HELRODRAFT_87912 [Helobdella robusta]ESN93929.1 hypothetical protein HELRODRAFT_87912 [Helobdella robusta]
MGKYITQETFDNVVWENIKEFEMSSKEAVKDAVEQFLAQGVDLSKVLKDAKYYENQNDDSIKMEVQTIMDTLKNANQNFNDASLTKTLCNFKNICDTGLPERCLFSELGACKILMQLISFASKQVLLDALLETFAAYVNQQPDVVDEDDIKVFISLFQGSCQNIVDSVSCSELTFYSCYKRPYYYSWEIISLFLDETCNLVTHVCRVLCALVRDDDVRVPFGQSYQHALSICKDCLAIQILLNSLQTWKSDEKVCSEIFVCLSTLCVCEDICMQVSEANGIILVFDVFVNRLNTNKKSHLIKSGLQLLKCLCGSDKIKRQIMEYDGGAQMVVELMEQNISNPDICEIACLLIASLALRHAEHGRKMVQECNAQHVICKAMVKHLQAAPVQRACGMAIRNVISRNENLIDCFLELDVEILLRKALEIHKEKCRDEIVYALRDLRCSVQLREMWTGTGKNLNQ